MGYVVERGRWYAVGYEGRHPTTGKDRRRRHRAEDETAARSLVASLPDRPRRHGHGLTLALYLHEEWLPAKQLASKPITFFRYQRMIETYVAPRLGRVSLRSLSTGHLTKLYAHLLFSGSATGGPLAPKRCSTCTSCCARPSATRCTAGCSPGTSRRSSTRHG